MSDKGTEPPGLLNSKWALRVFWLLIIAGVLAWFLVGRVGSEFGVKHVPYSELKGHIEAGEVSHVTLTHEMVLADLSEAAVKAFVVDAEEGEEAPKSWAAVVVRADEGLIPLLESKKIPYEARMESGCEDGGMMILWLLPLFIILMFWGTIMGRLGGGGGGAQVMTFGRSRHKLVAEEGTGVNFGDVAGCDEAKEELAEVVEFLKEPERFSRLGGHIPKGVLLVGPPGTGKTLLGRAVAGEAGVPFFNISGSDFVEMFVGVGAARVRDLFEQAQQKAPCIIFIDELDAIGKARGGGGAAGGNDEREQTLNALLVEMDGFDTRSGVILLAATNRPEVLDPALLRPGRFDRQVLVDRPDIKGRRAILAVHVRKVILSDEIDLDRIAAQTPGFAGADLANVVNEAALLAARVGKDSVEQEDFNEAIERVVAGLEKKSRRINPKEKRIVAYHESGHAIVAAALPNTDPVLKISIIPRGVSALGYTYQVPLEDRYLMTRLELTSRLCTLLGGRAAEQQIFGDVSTGAANDLERVTDMARSMITQYGMSPNMPNVSLESKRGQGRFLGDIGAVQRQYSDATAQAIDDEIIHIVGVAYERTCRILEENAELLEEMSQHLLEVEVLESEVLDSFLSRVQASEPPEVFARS